MAHELATATLDGGRRRDAVLVAGHERGDKPLGGEDLERATQDLRRVAASAMFGDHNEAYVPAFAFEVLVQFVTYRHPSDDLAIHLCDQERRSDPSGMWVPPGPLPLEELEVLTERCDTVSVQQKGGPFFGQLRVGCLDRSLIISPQPPQHQHVSTLLITQHTE